jgi:hypothetical protein
VRERLTVAHRNGNGNGNGVSFRNGDANGEPGFPQPRPAEDVA